MTIFQQMINKYQPKTLEDKKNIIKEVIQEIVLSALSKTDFFENAAFYGGTALRIFYGMDRFSEDLDFSLLESNANFELEKYFKEIKNVSNSMGLNFDISKKEKQIKSNIESAFIKSNTKEVFITFFSNEDDFKKIIHNEKIIIKFEVDINPPSHATTNIKYRLLPFPYQVRVYDIESLFAGKIHAVIARNWGSRIKGRDLYDYIYYLSLGTKVNLQHLEERLKQTKTIKETDVLTRELLILILNSRFENINYEQAKLDVKPFIKNIDSLELWTVDFFKSITKSIKC